ncbi:Serine/threonine-protein kinase ppk34 [Schizosaccharomyces pombe]
MSLPLPSFLSSNNYNSSETSLLTEGPESDEEDEGPLLKQYRLKNMLGYGACSTVYLAVDVSTNIEYAIKEFKKTSLRRREKFRLMQLEKELGSFNDMDSSTIEDQIRNQEKKDPYYYIRKELDVLKVLDHENVVKLYQVINSDYKDSLCMVLNYCPGGKLASVDHGISFDPMPLEICRKSFRQLVLAVNYIHGKGVIHRDIKPDNILFKENNNLCVIDFGLAEFLPKDGFVKPASGTPAFMAPELFDNELKKIKGKPLDIWSMGVTLYVIAFAEFPFNGSTILDMINVIKGKSLMIPAYCNSDLRKLLERCLEKNPEKRITIEELLRDPFLTERGKHHLTSSSIVTAFSSIWEI